MLQSATRTVGSSIGRPHQLAAVSSRIGLPTSRPAGISGRPSPAHESRRALTKCCAGKATKVNEEQLEVEIANRDRHLIVDFYATWCGPCVMLATELEKAAEELGDAVKVLKVDTDENPRISTALKIEGLPTIVFIPKEDGKAALRTEGLLMSSQLVQIVKEL